mgnify:CR=1 FL=1
MKKSERNYKGDLSKLREAEKDKILLESTLVHDAFIFGDWDRDVSWAFDELMIPVGFRYTGSWGIHLKSTRSSTVQFWIGIGSIIERNGEYIPTSFTYDQYLKVKPKLNYHEISLFPSSFKNLSKIAILKEN